MTVKLNSFSNKNLSLDHAKMTADTLASIFNDMIQASINMEAKGYESEASKEIFEKTFWRIYNTIGFIETDKFRHPHQAGREGNNKTIFENATK
tara:strand:+ start:377 stop:658 length:282 start_codon:yes stop_codon:yes gene_type:complete